MQMKCICTALLFCFFSFYANAQQSPLLVKTDKNGAPYLDHTIGAKENFYSIGRIYNISPRVFAPYNGIDLNSPLSIGQTLRIPLNEINFYQGGSSNENEVFVPLYHAVKSGENLPRIAQLFNTSVDQLNGWNQLGSQTLKAGQRIAIGFLKVDKNLSPLASAAKKNIPNTFAKAEVATVPVPAAPAQSVPTQKQPEAPKTVIPSEPITVIPAPVSYNGIGFFMEEYQRQTNNGKLVGEQERFDAGIFKSNSGWNDGKYYVLLEEVTKGTIVEITNLANGKVVYAKVLAGVEETSPGSEFPLRISNAAAAQLGITTARFEVALRWANQ